MYAKQVNPAKVESVAKLTARRICLMVAIGKLPLIAYQTARYASRFVGVPSFCRGSLVGICQKFVYCVFDGVCPAKRTDKPWLFQRVSCLSQFMGYGFCLTASRRPFAGILRVYVGAKNSIHVAGWPVLYLKNKLTVPARTRPIEKPRQLVCSYVEHVYTQSAGNLSAYWLVLVRLYVTAQRENQTQARFLRGVLMGAVEHGGEAKLQCEIIPHIVRAVVNIKRGHTAPHHVRRFASAARKITADEAANILDVGLLLLGHFQVFTYLFVCSLRLAATLDQVFPLPLFVFPLLR